jgi:hypothetical protein
MIYPALKQWFDMPIPEEYSQRRKTDELMCWTDAATKVLKPKKLHEVLGALANAQSEAVTKAPPWPAESRRAATRKNWAKLLGDTEPVTNPTLIEGKTEDVPGGKLSRYALEVEVGIVVPLLLITPKDAKGKRPVVVMFAQAGKAAFLKERGDAIAALLKAGVAVCLVDARGTGETRAGTSAERGSSRTSIAQTNLILGQPVLGSQLRDLRTVVRWLGTRDDLDGKKMGVWGDSFAGRNSKDINPSNINPGFPAGANGKVFNPAVPHDAAEFPSIGEPGAGLLADLLGVYEDSVRAIVDRGGLSSYRSILNQPYVYVPFDGLALGTRGPSPVMLWDVFDVQRFQYSPIRTEGMISALNETVGAPHSDPTVVAAWVIEKLKAK